MPATSDRQSPNVVLICTDQWRADCLGVEGHPCIDTPYLDMFAGSGSRFRRAYAATPSCIPARASLYTGLTQRTHGRVGYQDGVEWQYPVTIASAFRDQGYQTHAAGKMHVHPPRLRLGFDDVDLHDGYLHFNRKRTKHDLEMVDDYLPWLRIRAGADADYFDHGAHCNAYTPHPWDKDEMLHPTAWVTTKGVDFLRRRDTSKPFFLMLSYHRPQPPAGSAGLGLSAVPRGGDTGARGRRLGGRGIRRVLGCDRMRSRRSALAPPRRSAGRGPPTTVRSLSSTTRFTGSSRS